MTGQEWADRRSQVGDDRLSDDVDEHYSICEAEFFEWCSIHFKVRKMSGWIIIEHEEFVDGFGRLLTMVASQ